MKIHETGNRLAYIKSQLRQRPRYGHICIIEVDVVRLTMLVQRQLADNPFHGDRRVAEHADPAIYLMTMTTNDDLTYIVNRTTVGAVACWQLLRVVSKT